MVPLFAVSPDIGGLQVIPRSHLREAREKLKKRLPHLERRGDWCVVPGPHEVEPLLIICDAGDLILWDSRTVHGGKVGTGFSSPARPARLSVTVAMTKRERASKHVLNARRRAFIEGFNHNHTPHEAGDSAGTVRGMVDPSYVPIALTAAQRRLLDGVREPLQYKP